MLWKNLNENGRIPAYQECPFKKQCAIAQDDKCLHKGKEHEVDFSCAFARAFDLAIIH